MSTFFFMAFLQTSHAEMPCDKDTLLRFGENNYSLLNQYNLLQEEKENAPISLSSQEKATVFNPALTLEAKGVWSDAFIVKFNERTLCDRLLVALKTYKNEKEDRLLALSPKALKVELTETKLSFFDSIYKPLLEKQKEIAEIYYLTLLWVYSVEPHSQEIKKDAEARTFFNYTENSFRDIRGYLYFKKLRAEHGEDEAAFRKAIEENNANTEKSLKQICLNLEKNSIYCNDELEKAKKNSALYAFFLKYEKAAEDNYESFFKIESINSFVHYEKKDNKMALSIQSTSQPVDLLLSGFLESPLQIIQNFWNILYRFEVVEVSASVVFKSATEFFNNHTKFTDYKNAEIPILKEIPATEYKAKVMIARGFGRLLGFPDCTFVGYNTDEKVAFYYEIDPRNLMCSQSGKVQIEHYEEILENYFLHNSR